MEHLFFLTSIGVASLVMIMLSCVLHLNKNNVLTTRALWPLRVVAVIIILSAISSLLSFAKIIFFSSGATISVLIIAVIIALITLWNVYGLIRVELWGIIFWIDTLNPKNDAEQKHLLVMNANNWVVDSYKESSRSFIIWSTVSIVLFGVMTTMVIFIS